MKTIYTLILTALLFASLASAETLLNIDCPATTNPNSDFTCKAAISPTTLVTNVKFTVSVTGGFTLKSITPLGGLTGFGNPANGQSVFISALPLNLGNVADVVISSGAQGSGTVVTSAVTLKKDGGLISSGGSSDTVTITSSCTPKTATCDSYGISCPGSIQTPPEGCAEGMVCQNGNCVAESLPPQTDLTVTANNLEEKNLLQAILDVIHDKSRETLLSKISGIANVLKNHLNALEAPQ